MKAILERLLFVVALVATLGCRGQGFPVVIFNGQSELIAISPGASNYVSTNGVDASFTNHSGTVTNVTLSCVKITDYDTNSGYSTWRRVHVRLLQPTTVPPLLETTAMRSFDVVNYRRTRFGWDYDVDCPDWNQTNLLFRLEILQ